MIAAARHRFRHTDDVMAARSRIAARAVVVTLAIATEVELGKFTSVAVPLKDKDLGPIVPEGSGHDDILIDIDIGAFIRAANDGKPVSSGGAVHAPVASSELQVAQLVECFMNHEPSGVGMVSAVHAPWRRKEPLGKARAGAPFIHQRWKHARQRAPWKSVRIAWRDQLLREELFYNCCFRCLAHFRPVLHTGAVVGQRVLGWCPRVYKEPRSCRDRRG